VSDGSGTSLDAIFASEASELLEGLGKGLLALEEAGGGEGRDQVVREVFRLAHTLKGASASAGRDDLAEVVHGLETLLDAIRNGSRQPDKPAVDAALAAVDLLQAGLGRVLQQEEGRAAVERLAQARGAPASTPAPKKARRVSAAKSLSRVLPQLLGTLASVSKGDPGALHKAVELCASIQEAASQASPAFRNVASALGALLGMAQAEGRLASRALEGALMAVDFLQNDLQGAASPEEAGIVLASLRETPPVPEAPEHKAEPKPVLETTVRTPVALLDKVLYRCDELVALKLRLQYQTRQVEELQATFEGEARGGATTNQSLRRRLEVIRHNLAQEVHLLGIVAQALQDEVREIRMVPFGPMLVPLRRMVRDLAAALGKDVSLELTGEDVSADKRLLELVRDPLVHVLRNAVDHGIESPAERAKGGKPTRGKIELLVESRESHIWIQVRDDGRGIDADRIRRVAVERRLMDAEQARALSHREALNLIFTPGFSTASEVTEVSGRGVGLDIVRENVARCGGRIEFYSDPGKGAQFTFCLPLALAASRGLLVNAGKETYCLPLPAVEEVVCVEPADVGVVHGGRAIRRRNQTLSFVGLSELLADRPWSPPKQDACFAVILALSDRRLAVGVDGILGQEEIVVKGLTAGTPQLPYVAGATSLADGRLVTVLEAGVLMARAASVPSRARGATQSSTPTPTVLVADDSLTTRAMLVSLLERAGYRTLTAVDGEAAYSTLLSEKVDLLLTDFEMPNLDGLGLVRRLRASGGSFARVPVILLTSRGEAEDRARGAEAGADAYLVKASFDPQAFLSMVADFVGGPE